MKLSSQLFRDLVPMEPIKLASREDVGFRPGQVLHLPEGVFRVEAKVFSPLGAKFQLASVGDESNSIVKEEQDLSVLAPHEAKIAAFVRFAYNQDFDQYVKDAIREHGFPVDEDMNWSKWFEAKTRARFSYAGEDLRDEAVHNLLIWVLLDTNKLGEFDPSRLSNEVALRPLEKQITSYLSGIFSNRMDYVSAYIKKALGSGKEFSGESPEEDKPGVLDTAPSSEKTPEEVHQEAQSLQGFRRFRGEFMDWLESREAGFQRRSLEPMRILFDLIITTDNPQPRFLAEAFEDLSGASSASMKGYVNKLRDALVRFVDVAPQGLVTDALVRKLQAPANHIHSASTKEKTMTTLKEKIAALKAERTPKIDKWATLRRIADENPEEVGDALGELTAAFVELAEAADALAENLDLTTEEEVKEGVSKEGKARGSKKFAARLKRLAAENPGALSDALVEVYNTLDQVAEGIENLADNLGIELAPPEEALAPMGEEMPPMTEEAPSGDIPTPGETSPDDILADEDLAMESKRAPFKASAKAPRKPVRR